MKQHVLLPPSLPCRCRTRSSQGPCRSDLNEIPWRHWAAPPEPVRSGALHVDYTARGLRSRQRDNGRLRAVPGNCRGARGRRRPTPQQRPRRTECSRTTSRTRRISIQRMRHRWRRYRMAPAKTDGIATGGAAAAQMIARRVGDGASPSAAYLPTSSIPGEWADDAELLPGRRYQPPSAGTCIPFGILEHPGGQEWIGQFLPGPPPALTSDAYTKDYNEVKMVGNLDSTGTAAESGRCGTLLRYDRTGCHASTWSRQVAFSERRVRSRRTRGPGTGRHGKQRRLHRVVRNEVTFYTLWRPETAIRVGDMDGNEKTAPTRLRAVHYRAVLSS